MNRFHTMDYLRGLSAFGIMVYHYLTWNVGVFSSDTFMGRVGVYGVAVFYVLSGLTLYLVYYHKMTPSMADIRQFAKKRFYRIFPLLWLVTIISIALSRNVPNLFDLFLNVSGLFGFVKWYAYFSTGVWSIGNELVFYSLFPVFVLLGKKSGTLLLLASVIIFMMYLYFAFVHLDPQSTIADEWRDYINPLNQVFLFLGGFLMGRCGSNFSMPGYANVLVFVFALGVFIFYPAQGDTIHIVTGVNRIVFTFATLLVCLSVFKMKIKLPELLHKPLSLLGEASYSVYLLHPIVYAIGSQIFTRLDPIISLPWYVKVTACGLASLILSYFVYQYFEKYFMRKARRKEGERKVVET